MMSTTHGHAGNVALDWVETGCGLESTGVGAFVGLIQGSLPWGGGNIATQT